MSQWGVDHTPPHTNHRRLALVLVVAGTILLGGFVCTGLLIRQVWEAVRVQKDFVAAATGIGDADALDRRWEEVQSAYLAKSHGAPPTELAKLQEFFEFVADACGKSDTAAFRSHCDFHRMATAVRESPVHPPLNFIERMQLEQTLSAHQTPAGPWQRCEIRRVERLGKDGRVVYTYCWFTESEMSPVCWWLHQQGNEWRIYDWHALEYGMRISDELALRIKHHAHLGVAQYDLVSEDIKAADRARERGDSDTVQRHLEMAESRRILPQF